MVGITCVSDDYVLGEVITRHGWVEKRNGTNQLIPIFNVPFS